MRLLLCLESMYGQHTIVASVVKIKNGLESPSFHFILSFSLSETTKMENNRRVIPASLWDLDKERSSAFKSLPDLSRGAHASSFLAQSFLLFPLVRLAWPVCWVIVLCLSNSSQVCCQKPCISLTDASCISSLVQLQDMNYCLLFSG